MGKQSALGFVVGGAVCLALACSSSAPPVEEPTGTSAAALATCGSHWIAAPGTFTPGDLREYLVPSSVVLGGAGTSTLVFMGGSTTVTCSFGTTGAFASCGASGAVPGSAVLATSVTLSSAAMWASANIGWTERDGNPCTTDTCPSGLPVHTPVAVDTACATGNACQIGKCDSNATCAVAGTLPLSDGNPCTTDSCDSTTGVHYTYDSACSKPSGGAPLDLTRPYDFAAATAHIRGPNVDVARAAILRGRVLDGDGSTGLAGVSVSVLGHSEGGTVLTRQDGWYDIAINGGGNVVLDFATSGRLPAQRTVEARWQDYTVVADVRLIEPTQTFSTLTHGSSSWQYAKGPATSDNDGSREPVVIVRPGTTIASFSDSQYRLRITEFTVGANGPDKMPGSLPPLSFYTYAADFGVEHTSGTPVSPAQFNQDVFVYVNDLLGVAVGTRVPAGWYDRAAGHWVPADWSGAVDGCVVQITGYDGSGWATVDSGGCALTLDDGERAQLGAAYPNQQGKRFWRTPVRHFSNIDFNWPGGSPGGATPPPNGDPQGGPPDDPCAHPGEKTVQASIVECTNQTLGEELPVAGTPYVLRYASERSPGSGTVLVVPITDAGPIPTALQRIEVEIQVAGQRAVLRKDGPFLLNDSIRWKWDHTDGYGNFVQGEQDARIDVRYVYFPTVQAPSPGSSSSFGLAGAGTIQSVNRQARELWWTRRYRRRVGSFDALPLGFGGWMLSAQHVYDPRVGALYGGDGSRASAAQQTRSVVTVAGGKRDGEGAPGPAPGLGATSVHLLAIQSVAQGPSGNVYFATSNQIWAAKPDGTLALVAGNTNPYASFADGAMATNVGMTPVALAVSPNEDLYVATGSTDHQVIRVTGGAVFHVAGTGQGGYGADGTPAVSEKLNNPRDVAVAVDGSVLIADTDNHRVRRVQTNGIITTVAGTGAAASGSDGGLGPATAMKSPAAVESLRSGEVLVATDHSIRKIRVDGVVETIAGTPGVQGAATDGSVATASKLDTPISVKAGAEGTLYLIEGSGRVRAIDPSGVLRRVVNEDDATALLDGAPALDTKSRLPYQLAVGPDGCLLYGEVSCSGNECSYQGGVAGLRVRKTCAPSSRYGSEYIVPRPDGSEAYRFDLDGRHQRTVTGLRGQDRAVMSYSSGLLSSIREGTTTLLTIDRSSPSLVRLVARGGQTTQILLGAGGYATGISMGTGDMYAVTHEQGTGFLTHIEEPTPREGFQHDFSYDADGLLFRDRDSLPFTAGMTLTRSYDRWGHSVLRDTPEGRTWTHVASTDPALLSLDPRASSIRIHTDPVGRKTSTETRLDGEIETIEGAQLAQASEKIVTTTHRAADPRWQLAAPFASSVKTTTAGATRTRQSTRGVTLASADPFSLSGATAISESSWQDDTNGASSPKWTRTFDAAAGKWVLKPPVHDGSEVYLWPDDRLKKVKLLGAAGTATLADVDFTWDAGRLKTVSQAGHQVTYNYSGQDVFPTSVVGPMGRTLQFLSRDGSGRPTRLLLPSTQGAERYVDLAYDESGNLSLVRPPNGNGQTSYDHTMSWNAVNSLDTYAPPNVVSPKDTGYGYDRDRLLQTDATPSGTIAYTYDQAARVGTRQHPNATTTYSYDATTKRLTQVADNGGITLDYAWSGPLLTQLSYSGTAGSSSPNCGLGKHCIQYGYFSDSDPPAKRGKKKWRRLDGVNEVDFDYDAEGALSTVTVGSYVYTLNRGGQGHQGFLESTTVGNVTETFDYDQWGALKTQVVQGGGTECFKIDSVLRDDVGRITRKRDTVLGSATTWDYAYRDQEGWLSSANDFGPQDYDKDGNRLGRSYDTQDRITTGGGWNNWTWTNDGALSAVGNGNPLYYWTFDLLGNQRAAWGPGRNRTYAIDGRDHRVIIRDNGNVIRQYLWDEDDRLVAQLDATGNVWMQFVYASRSHVPDLLVMGSSVYRMVHDQVGSVRLILDVGSASCNAVQAVSYTTWGIPTFSGAWGGGYQPFGFAGGLYDEVTTQTRFGAREYDAWGGRWFTKDRSRFDGGLNLYAYCENDPVNCIDPTGNTPEGAALGAVAGTIFGTSLGFGIGVGVGGAGGAILGAPTGPGAVVTGVGGAVAGGLEGGTIGGVVGAGVGAWLGGKLTDWAGSGQSGSDGAGSSSSGCSPFRRPGGSCLEKWLVDSAACDERYAGLSQVWFTCQQQAAASYMACVAMYGE